MATKHNTLSARNGQKSIESRAFSVAFVPPKTQPNITEMWSLKASDAIAALIDFRSAVHRWQANGCIPDVEFVRELEKLADIGLDCWVDELMALAVCAVLGGER